MKQNDDQVRAALAKCSILELAVETIESGKGGLIDDLQHLEPIPMRFLLEEASVRLGKKFASRAEFINAVLAPNSALDESTQAVLQHAVKIKRIEEKFASH